MKVKLPNLLILRRRFVRPNSQMFRSRISSTSRYLEQLRRTEPQSVFWRAAFWANLVFCIALTYSVLCATVSNSSKTPSFIFQRHFGDYRSSISAIGLGCLFSFFFTIVHLIYACTFPNLYIKTGIYFELLETGLLFAGWVIADPSVLLSPFSWIGGVIAVIGSVLWFRYCRSRSSFTTALLQQTGTVLLTNPVLVGIELGYLIVSAVLTSAVAVAGFLVFELTENWFPMIVYLVFTYFWTMNALYYALYMGGAGVTASYFYVGKGEAGRNFGRAFGPLFGVASLCGFALGAIQTARFVLRALRGDREEKEEPTWRKVARAIAHALLEFLEQIVGQLSKWSLIFCGMFGCSLKEGFQRSAEESWQSAVTRNSDRSVIVGALRVHHAVVALLAGVAAFVCGGRNAMLAGGAAVASSIVGGVLVNGAFTTISEALQLCFMEAPTRMQEVNPGLFAQMNA
jgi:hypothetical protein